MSTTKDIGALIIRIGFLGAQYTIMIIRNPPQPYSNCNYYNEPPRIVLLIIEAPIL